MSTCDIPFYPLLFRVNPYNTSSKPTIDLRPIICHNSDFQEIDLWEYLSNKRKLRSEKPVNISPSHCGQAGCQLMTVNSVHCVGSIPITPLLSQQSVFNRLSAITQTSKRPKSLKKKTPKVPDLSATSCFSKNCDVKIFN